MTLFLFLFFWQVSGGRRFGYFTKFLNTVCRMPPLR